MMRAPRARGAQFLAGPAGLPGLRAGSRGSALVENLRYVLRALQRLRRSGGDAPHRSQAGRPGRRRLARQRRRHRRWPLPVRRQRGVGPGSARCCGPARCQRTPVAVSERQRPGAVRACRADGGCVAGQAPPLFDVAIPHAIAASAIESYANSQALIAQPALACVGSRGAAFSRAGAVRGREPIPVMHSDEGFLLLFAEPEPRVLDRIVATVMRPFPAGLMTGAGMVVANPVFCAPALQNIFTRNAYHGTVVWSWQQALFAAGLARQLERHDLPAAVRADLMKAQRVLWSAIDGYPLDAERGALVVVVSGAVAIRCGRSARQPPMLTSPMPRSSGARSIWPCGRRRPRPQQAAGG